MQLLAAYLPLCSARRPETQVWGANSQMNDTRSDSMNLWMVTWAPGPPCLIQQSSFTVP